MSKKRRQPTKTARKTNPKPRKWFMAVVFGLLSILVVAINLHTRTAGSHPNYAVNLRGTGMAQNSPAVMSDRRATDPQFSAPAITAQTADRYAGLPIQEQPAPSKTRNQPKNNAKGASEIKE